MSIENARRAAAMLPDAPKGPADNPDGMDNADKAGLWFGVAVMFATAIVGLIALLLRPWGWVMVASGIPLWLVVRWIFVRMRGSETGMVTVDDDGLVRVVSGHSAVRRLQRLPDVGAGRWMGHTWLNATALLVVGLGVPTAIAILLDTPVPVGALLSALCFGMLDLLRFFGTMALAGRKEQTRKLDGSAMLPALAIYARAHGWQKAVSGVPADQLAITLAARPDEVAVAKSYTAKAAFMNRLAALGGELF